jgi:hypothetical protein
MNPNSTFVTNVMMATIAIVLIKRTLSPSLNAGFAPNASRRRGIFLLTQLSESPHGSNADSNY